MEEMQHHFDELMTYLAGIKSEKNTCKYLKDSGVCPRCLDKIIEGMISAQPNGITARDSARVFVLVGFIIGQSTHTIISMN